MEPTSGLILAGGKSTRLGTDKASLFLDRVVRAIEPYVAEVLIAGPDHIPDLFPDHGPLSGIYSAMLVAQHDRCLVAACDMPFIQPGIVQRLIALSGDEDALVPRIDGRPQPLLALYRKTCLPALKQTLEEGELKVELFLDRVRVRHLTEENFLETDLVSFFNVNRPEDLKRAEELGF